MLAVVGDVLPLLAFGPWVIACRLDIRLFVGELSANRIASSLRWNVIISAMTCLSALVHSSGTMTSRQSTGLALGTLCVGVSPGLLLYGFFREQERTKPPGQSQDEQTPPKLAQKPQDQIDHQELCRRCRQVAAWPLAKAP